jgi:hypothetical protein
VEGREEVQTAAPAAMAIDRRRCQATENKQTTTPPELKRNGSGTAKKGKNENESRIISFRSQTLITLKQSLSL